MDEFKIERGKGLIWYWEAIRLREVVKAAFIEGHDEGYGQGWDSEEVDIDKSWEDSDAKKALQPPNLPTRYEDPMPDKKTYKENLPGKYEDQDSEP